MFASRKVSVQMVIVTCLATPPAPLSAAGAFESGTAARAFTASSMKYFHMRAG